jgi:membrane protein
MLVVIIFLTSLFWGREAVEIAVLEQMKNIIGPAAALQMQEIIKNAAVYDRLNITDIIVFITLLFGTTSVFSEIKDSINIIWGVKRKRRTGFLKSLSNRVVSLSIVVSWFFILLVSLIFNGIALVLIGYIKSFFPGMSEVLALVLNLLFTFFASAILFAIIFKVLPSAKVSWKDVWVGACCSAFFFLLGKLLVSFYVGQSNISNTYGAAGSLIILLIWIYYSSNVLYFGAEFTKAYAMHYGGISLPVPDSVPTEIRGPSKKIVYKNSEKTGKSNPVPKSSKK